MSIRFKLLTIITLTLITFLFIVLYAMYVYRGTLADEQEIRDRITHSIEVAHQTESQFHVQLNAWKNVLLRGADANKYFDYLKEYYTQERKTRVALERLNVYISDTQDLHKLSKHLRDAHLEMGRKFREALRVFNATEVNPGQITDQYVAGAEDESSLLIQKIIDQLKLNRNIQVDSLDAERKKQENILIALVILTMLISI